MQEPAEELRQLELMRLDDMYVKALEREHQAVSLGKVVRHVAPVPVLDVTGQPVMDPETGKPLTEMRKVDVLDDGPVLAALDRMLRIQERRARLLSLDAPVKKRVEVIAQDQLTAEIERLDGDRRPGGRLAQ